MIGVDKGTMEIVRIFRRKIEEKRNGISFAESLEMVKKRESILLGMA